MHSLMQFGAKTLLEVLGSVERSSPDPRRNTSKTFFEAFGSRNKATTCCSFVTALERLADTLLQLCYSFRLSNRDEAATSNDLTLDQSASYYGS
jgi:hypothetical protein